MHSRALLLIVLFSLPNALAGVALGPDADGAWALRFELSRDAAGPARLALDVRREAEDVVVGWRDLGVAQLPAGASTREASFLPAEGAGRYVVSLVVDGARGDAVAFDVDEGGASRTVRFDVPDEPTFLNLTPDDVNANGKLKSPGEALLTRAVVSDANGIGELEEVRWRVERGGAALDGGLVPLPASANATSHAFEVRFDRAPFEAGNASLELEAWRAGAVVARASRTFSIREVAPSMVAGTLANATPDAESCQNATVTLADKNGAAGPGPFEARVYRGSARAEATGFAVSLGAPARAGEANGAGLTVIPVALCVPARAAAGAYRVSLYHDGTLLASLPFEVRALPALHGVVASTSEGRLALAVNASGEGFLLARLVDGAGASTRVAAPVSSDARLELVPPRRGAPLRWIVELVAREGGPVLGERNGTWTPPAEGPALTLAPASPRGRLPATWRLDARVGEPVNATFRFTRWDGADEASLRGEVVGDRVRIAGPPELPPGRYGASLFLAYPNGSASELRWSFEAGAWIELTLGSPEVQGRVALVPVRNAGAVSVTRLLVEVEPHARVSLLVGDAALAPRLAGERAQFDGFGLLPGEGATLRVELPDAPVPAGLHAVAVRVLARAEVH